MNLKMVLVVMVAAAACLCAPAAALAQKDTTTGSTSCMQSIATGCNGGGTAAELDQCCSALTNAVTNAKTCFCLLKPTPAEAASNSDGIAALFDYCGINGTFDTICTGSSSSSTSSDSSTPVNNPFTTSTNNSSTGSSGTTGGLRGGKKNAGNKVAMMSLSILLVGFACVMMIGGI